MNYAGLTSVQAKKKLDEFGFNEIKEILTLSILKTFLSQISFVVYLLSFAVILSFLINEPFTGIVIGVVILIVVFTGFIQEYSAEKAVKSLKTMIVPTTIVVRDGREQKISTRELVPGDIVILQSGEKIPADCVVLESTNLRVNESVLTGESIEVTKKKLFNEKKVREENKLFMGTMIVRGKGIGRVTKTGMSTQFGRIAGMISTAEKELPLKNKVNEIIKKMVLIGVVFSVLTGVIMFVRAEEMTMVLMVEIIMVVIAISVSAFPEGFPIVLTTTLALGAKRMAEKNAIVNKMSIIETLGETTVVCSDKTGTITTGEMTVKKIILANEEISVSGVGFEKKGAFLKNNKLIDPNTITPLKKILESSVICNNALIEKNGFGELVEPVGTATEIALLVLAAKANLVKGKLIGQRVREIPFDSEEKTMSVLYSTGKELVIHKKGAPDIIIDECEYLQLGDKIVKFTPKLKKEFEKKQQLIAREGNRVLGFAYVPTTKRVLPTNPKGLIFLGLTSIMDPPRQEVIESIKECYKAGIKVKMITGDYKETAFSIAKQVGIKGGVMLGSEIDELNDEELEETVKKINIFARVKPEHKLRIVRALKNVGEIVSMTGDGVNDAPALKEAHIGIAMGKNGSDVSRESADLILKDDNFATIVSAIEEGRTIYSNVRKFVTFQLSCNAAELMILFLSVLIGLPLPLIALQILLMNIVTDDLPAITLGLTPPSKTIMNLKPIRNSSLLNKREISFIFLSSIIIGLFTIGIFWVSLAVFKNDLITSRTIALITLVFFEIFNAFNYRSLRLRFKETPFLINKPLILASIASTLIILTVIYSPLNTVFGVTPIHPIFWVGSILTASTIIFIVDYYKKLIAEKVIRLVRT